MLTVLASEPARNNLVVESRVETGRPKAHPALHLPPHQRGFSRHLQRFLELRNILGPFPHGATNNSTPKNCHFRLRRTRTAHLNYGLAELRSIEAILATCLLFNALDSVGGRVSSSSTPWHCRVPCSVKSSQPYFGDNLAILSIYSRHPLSYTHLRPPERPS